MAGLIGVGTNQQNMASRGMAAAAGLAAQREMEERQEAAARKQTKISSMTTGGAIGAG